MASALPEVTEDISAQELTSVLHVCMEKRSQDDAMRVSPLDLDVIDVLAGEAARVILA